MRIGEKYDIGDKSIEAVSLDNQTKARLAEKGLNNIYYAETRKNVLKDAKIICGTLSSAGSAEIYESGLVN